MMRGSYTANLFFITDKEGKFNRISHVNNNVYSEIFEKKTPSMKGFVTINK